MKLSKKSVRIVFVLLLVLAALSAQVKPTFALTTLFLGYITLGLAEELIFFRSGPPSARRSARPDVRRRRWATSPSPERTPRARRSGRRVPRRRRARRRNAGVEPGAATAPMSVRPERDASASRALRGLAAIAALTLSACDRDARIYFNQSKLPEDVAWIGAIVTDADGAFVTSTGLAPAHGEPCAWRRPAGAEHAERRARRVVARGARRHGDADVRGRARRRQAPRGVGL